MRKKKELKQTKMIKYTIKKELTKAIRNNRVKLPSPSERGWR